MRSTFGANQWLVDELYERYLTDKDSVDPAWWDFFADYRPRSETLAAANGVPRAATVTMAWPAADADTDGDGAAREAAAPAGTAAPETTRDTKTSRDAKTSRDTGAPAREGTTAEPGPAAPAPPPTGPDDRPVSYTHLTLPTNREV